MIFPRENDFDTLIKNVIAHVDPGQHPSIVKGFIAAESGFKPEARREEPQIQDASFGLMQVLSRTAKGLGYTGNAVDLMKPEVNILYGVKLLRQLYTRFGATDKVAAAYNMGSPVLAAAQKPGAKKIYGEPMADWKWANQPYVDKVLTYAGYYRAVETGDLKRAAMFADIALKKNSTPGAIYSETTSDGLMSRISL